MMEELRTISFGQPWWLLLLLLVPVVAWLNGQMGKAPAVRYSALGILREISAPVRRHPGAWLKRLGLVTLTLCIVAMARPRRDLGQSPDRREGVDIVFCVDVSGSMDQRDFPHATGRISKREANILAIADFVDRRPNDRFGMVGFAKDTYILSPLTIDGNWIKDVLKEIELKAWTAIGEGIETSVNLLKDSPSKSKIIVVTSDGGNNYGVSPLEAAQSAARDKIRVYTVQFMSPNKVGAGNANSLMAQIAARTGGMYFQTSSLDSMVSIYRQIDQLEKSRFEQKQFRLYDELFPWLVAPALGILLVSWLGGNTLWLRVP